jgi:UDP-glucose 4-epimerase
VLIIGASGFLGKNLIEELPSDRYSIIATYNKRNNIDITKAVPYQLDLSDRGNVKELLTKNEFDLIFYFSSLTNVGKSIEQPLLDNMNIVHMLTFLEELIHVNYLGKMKFLYASSGGTVYGDSSKVPISENQHLEPLSPYGITKVAIENYLKFYEDNHKLNYVILRYANPYGRFQDQNSGTGVPNIFLHKVLNDEPIYIVGNPKEIYRDYIYITDAIDITLKIAESPNNEKVYNIGLGDACSIDNIVNVIETVTHKKAKIILREPGKGLVEKVILDTRKVMEEYSWSPKFQIAEGIYENYKWINSLLKKKHKKID